MIRVHSLLAAVTLLVLLGCTHAATSRVQPSSTPESTMSPSPALKATLVVHGVLHVRAGFAPAIAIETIYKGAAAWGVKLEPRPELVDGAEAIYFLEPTTAPRVWRILPASPSALGEPTSEERRVIRELSGVRAPDPAPAMLGALAAYRAGTSSDITKARAAVDAARDVYENVDVIGMDPARVERWFGPGAPMDDESWLYVRIAEARSVARSLRFEQGRVVAVTLHRTQ